MAGFSLLLLSEPLAMRGKKASKALRSLGYCLIIAALALYASPAVAVVFKVPVTKIVAETGSTNEAWTKAMTFLSEQTALFYLTFVTALGSGVMLVWTVFFELALGRKKLQAEKTDAVSWGSYGICRHPGFWWLALYMLSMGIVRGFSPSVVPAFLVIFFNFLLVEVQDRYSFPRIFKDYEAYRKKVPFLIPGFIKKGTHHR